MKRIPLILPTLVALTLSGCNTTQEVAYWTDASYKSTLDYDAEQKKELEDEIGSVHSAIKDIVDNNMNDLNSGNNIDTTPQEPEGATVILKNANRNTCLAYFRKYFSDNSQKYKDYYLDVEMYVNTSTVPTGEGSPVIEHGGKKYINLVNASTVSTVTDEDFYNYMLAPFSQIFTSGDFTNNPNGITMDYDTFKSLLPYALDYFKTGESLGIS